MSSTVARGGGRPRRAGRLTSRRRGGRAIPRLLRTPALALASVVVAVAGISCGGGELRGVVIIGVDTLRADHLGLHGHSRDTSPALDHLAEDAVVFEHAYSTSSWTLPAFASMLTGQHPLGHGAGVRKMRELGGGGDVSFTVVAGNRFSAIHADVPTVTERFAAAGFATAAVVQNPYMSPQLGLHRAFDTYDHVAGGNREIRRADQAVDRALEWIDGLRQERFFLFLHLFDPHLDYDPPPDVRGEFTGEPRFGEFELPVSGLWPIRNRADRLPDGYVGFMTAAYDEEIRFVDAQVGRFVEALRERRRWDELLVVLTSDHGEEFFEHGGFEHGHDLHDEVVRVPLLLWAPGIEPGRRQVPVSLADVGPTVLEAAGLEPLAGPGARGDDATGAANGPGPDGTETAPTTSSGAASSGTFGRSLWPSLVAGTEPERRLLVAHGTLYGDTLEAAVLWPYKLIRRADDGAGVLYDLSADPGEQHDLGADLPEVWNGLSAGLDGVLDRTALEALSEHVELSEATLETLRSLGYIR